jgi:hypothetical protein
MAATRKRLRKAPLIPRASRRKAVTRREFDRMIDILNQRVQIVNEIRAQVEENRRDLEVQIVRFAQVQADLDLIKRELARRERPGTHGSQFRRI